MRYTRTKNAVLNIFFGYLCQILVMILNIIGRKIFLKYLSIDYLGIDGLFSNVLTLLSLGELGLDTAATYSLYKPANDNNYPLLHSLIKFYKKMYLVFAIGVFIVGLSISPFLKQIITSDLSFKELVIYYVLFLTNTVISYFVASQVILLNAYQEQRIYKFAILLSNLVLQVLHILVLIIWKNYYLYVGSSLITTLLTSVILSIICRHMHSEVFSCNEETAFEKKAIVSRVFSTILYKVGGVLINGTDNILISSLVSTAAVGLYSNYYTIISGVQTFISIISSSLISGIGNMSVQNNSRQKTIFPTILLLFHYIASLGFIGFTFLINDLISIWIGSQYVFEGNIVIIIALNFYITNAIAPIWMFREANGLFNETRYVLQIRAGINILLSIILGKIWGTFGVLLATFISLLITNFWFEPRLLFEKVFKTSVRSYWFSQIKYCVITVISYFICNFVFMNHFFKYFVVKCLIVLCITSLLYVIICFKSDAFKTGMTYLRRKK